MKHIDLFTSAISSQWVQIHLLFVLLHEKPPSSTPPLGQTGCNHSNKSVLPPPASALLSLLRWLACTKMTFHGKTPYVKTPSCSAMAFLQLFNHVLLNHDMVSVIIPADLPEGRNTLLLIVMGHNARLFLYELCWSIP